MSSTMHDSTPERTRERVASAEAEALEAEAREQLAEASFDRARQELQATGQLGQLTGKAEFRSWMDARTATDAAWGRWAMAMDAHQASNR